MTDQTTLERLRTILAEAKGYRDALTAWRHCPAAFDEDWFLEQRDGLEDATFALSRALDLSVVGIPGQVSRSLKVLRESTEKHVREFEQDDRPVLGDDELPQVGTGINVLDRYVAQLRCRVPGGMRSAAAGLDDERIGTVSDAVLEYTTSKSTIDRMIKAGDVHVVRRRGKGERAARLIRYADLDRAGVRRRSQPLASK